MKLSLFIAAILFLFGILLFVKGNPTLLILSLFLLIAALREQKNSGEKRIESYFHRRERLKKNGQLSARILAVPAEIRLADALRFFEGERYTLLLAVDGDMHVLGTFDEGSLLLRAGKEGPEARLFSKEQTSASFIPRQISEKELKSFSSLR